MHLCKCVCVCRWVGGCTSANMCVCVLWLGGGRVSVYQSFFLNRDYFSLKM